MSSVKNVEILTNLEEDPHVAFFAWELDVFDVAAGMAKSIHHHGLLSHVLTDEQWAAYPDGNAVPDQNGNIVIAPRYTPPVYVDIHDGMTNIAMYVANASNTKLQLWVDSLETLKRAVIKSLGKVIRQVIKESKVRFQLMTVADMIAKVRQRYGTMEKNTKANLKERMMTMLPTMDGIDTHISNLREMFDVSETAGFPVDNIRKIEIFRETVCAHPLIVKVLETFDFDFPDVKATTFEQIHEYLTLHLPNVTHAQMAATRATANLASATAYSTLEAESNKLRAELKKLKRKRQPNQNKTRTKTQKQHGGKDTTNKTRPERRTADEPTDNMQYCYAHGFQHSHNSSECKLLSGDKQKFNAEMRRSKGPKHPPGGSTKVNAQVPSKNPKAVAANLVFAQDDDEDNAIDYDNEDDDTYDETTAFLTNVMNEQAR